MCGREAPCGEWSWADAPGITVTATVANSIVSDSIASGCGWFWYDAPREMVVHGLPHATSSISQSERLSMSDSAYRPCSACHGDCDSDDDCAAGLICFQRDGSEAVPGCTDPADDYDYCYNPNLLWITAATPTALHSVNQTSAVSDCPVGVTGQAAHTTHSHHGGSRRVSSTIVFVPFCDVTGCDHETKMRQGVWSVGLLFTAMLLVIPVQLLWCARILLRPCSLNTHSTHTHVCAVCLLHRQLNARGPFPMLQAAGG